VAAQRSPEDLLPVLLGNGDTVSNEEALDWVRDAARRLGSPAAGVDWEDVAQLAGMLVLRDAPRAFRGDTRESLRAYCRRVAKRQFLMERRVAERRAALAAKIPDQPPHGAMGYGDALTLKEILGRLSRECSRTLRLYFLDGFSHREIGRVLAISEVAARKRASRCMERARELADG